MRSLRIGIVVVLALLAVRAEPASAQEAFIGEIRMVPFTFAPRGWAFCDGQLLSISQNTALFSLLGTTFGGDGITTFALPDLRGRVAVHAGTGTGLPERTLGSTGGTPTTDTVNLIGKPRGYAPGEVVALAGHDARAVAAGGQADDKMPPFLTVNFIIALQGIYPARD